MNCEYPNIAVKRSPKNTWIIVEYVGTLYDKKHWSINGHFKRKAKTIAEYKTFEEAANTSEPTKAKEIKNGKHRLIAMD